MRSALLSVTRSAKLERVESSAASPQPTSTTLLLTVSPARLLTERTTNTSCIMAILTNPASPVPRPRRQTRQFDRRRHQANARTGMQTAPLVGKLVHYADPRERKGLCQGPLPSVAGATPVSRLRSERGTIFWSPTRFLFFARCSLPLLSVLLKAPGSWTSQYSPPRVGRRSDQFESRSRESRRALYDATRRDFLRVSRLFTFRFLSFSISPFPALSSQGSPSSTANSSSPADLPLVTQKHARFVPWTFTLSFSWTPHSTRRTSLPHYLVPQPPNTHPPRPPPLCDAFLHLHLPRTLVTRALGRRFARTLLRSPGRDPQAGRVHRARGSETRQPRAEKVVVEQEEAGFSQVVAAVVVIQVVRLVVVLLHLARQHQQRCTRRPQVGSNRLQAQGSGVRLVQVVDQERVQDQVEAGAKGPGRFAADCRQGCRRSRRIVRQQLVHPAGGCGRPFRR